MAMVFQSRLCYGCRLTGFILLTLHVHMQVIKQLVPPPASAAAAAESFSLTDVNYRLDTHNLVFMFVDETSEM